MTAPFDHGILCQLGHSANFTFAGRHRAMRLPVTILNGTHRLCFTRSIRFAEGGDVDY